MSEQFKRLEPEDIERRLKECRVTGPGDLDRRVMQSLNAPPVRRKKWQRGISWPTDGWLTPALAGAFVMMLVWGGVELLTSRQQPVAHTESSRVMVTFQLHAPEAGHVELAGSFNDWDVGSIELNGPDATGNWTVDLVLPEGRHEYLFLVDGEEWITDPTAVAYRDDGFGRRNAVLEL
jgi:hypothetical protein